MTRLRVALPEENVSWTVELLDEQAPRICAAVLEALPLEAALVHGKFSGEEVFAPTDREELLDLPKENLEDDVQPGDVGYWYSHRDDGAHVHEREEFGELVFIYGRRARPRMGADRTVAIDLIGRVSGNAGAFAEAAARRQREGATPMRVERADG